MVRVYYASATGERHFRCSTTAELPTSGLLATDTAYTMDNGKRWRPSSSTTWIEEPYGGAGGSCQVPSHESTYNHSLLHSNSMDHDGSAQDSIIASKETPAGAQAKVNAHAAEAAIAGDYIEIKEVQPTWATNPANIRRSAVIYIE